MPATPYVTRAEAKTFAGEAADDAFTNAIYDQLIVDASAGVDLWAGRTFGALASRTEYYDGNGEPVLVLARRPVALSGLAVSLDSGGAFGQKAGGFADSTLLALGDDYALVIDSPTTASTSESGLLRWLGGRRVPGWPAMNVPGWLTPWAVRPGWPAGIGNIRVVYSAGYATVPDEIKTATKLLVQKLKAQTDNNRFQTTGGSIGPYSFSKSQLTYFAREVFDERSNLARFRELAI